MIESGTMFGKTKDLTDHDSPIDTESTIGEFFGDEAAVAEVVRVDHLHERVVRVEQQVSSQFTSLAAYAQIAQEQVELVRSEAAHASERSEQKTISLIERERADRLAAGTGGVDVTARLDSLERQIGEIREGLQQCLSNQKALADAITDLFTAPSKPAVAEPGFRVPDATTVVDQPLPTPMPTDAETSLEIDDELVTIDVLGHDLLDELPPPPPGAAVEPIDFPLPGLVDRPITGLALI